LKLFTELRRRNVLGAAVAYVVTAWVIVEASSLLLSIFKAPDWVAQTIVIMLVAGFPVAIAFAWMFEITPEGIKPDHEVSRDAGVTATSSRYLVMITIVMGMLAVGLFVVDRFLIESDEPLVRRDGPPIIAVLPFEVVGSTQGATLANGLHHDLLTRLSKLRAFAVISRTSMLEYRDTTRNIRDIGRELGADFILEGGVQLAGDRVRVNAQLIDAGFDEHRWADTYDRELTATDLFAIQSELAIDIAGQLKLTLSPQDRERAGEVSTENTEAYAAYLRGLVALDDPGLGADRRNITYAEIEKAIELDPGFTAALAQFVKLTSSWGGIWDDYDAMHAETTAVLERLRQIAPGSYDAGIAEVYYQYFVLNDFGEVLPAIARLENRGALGPDAHYMRGKALRRAGRLEDAYAAYLAAARLDPRSRNVVDDLRTTAILLGDCERAGLHAAALLAISPDDIFNRISAADYELQCTGDAEHATELVLGFERTHVGAFWTAATAAAVARDHDRLLNLLEHGEPSPNWWGDRLREQLVMAKVLAWQGRDAEAVLNDIESVLFADRPPEENPYLQNSYVGMRMRYSALRNDRDEARRWADELARRFDLAHSWDPVTRAGMYQFLAFEFADAGHVDYAIDALEFLFAGPSFITFRFVESHLAFDDLRDDPRYAELKQKYGTASGADKRP
jgi:TolB-like protein